MRHRQTKGPETGRSDLKQPRHTSTLHDSCTIRKDGEELVRVVFDLEVRRKPQAFAAVAVGIDMYIINMEFQ